MFRWLLFLLMGAAIVAAFMVPPANFFPEPQLARIIFFHLPCAISTPLFLLAAAYFGVRFLQSGDMKWDLRSAAANEVGYILALLTMATGILFSRMQWRAWWQWDPRQTSFLLLLLLYAAYFALRGALGGDERRRALNTAAYTVISILPGLFLIFVFPRLPMIERNTFHPNTALLDTWQRGRYEALLDRGRTEYSTRLERVLQPEQRAFLTGEELKSDPAKEGLNRFDYDLVLLSRSSVLSGLHLSAAQKQETDAIIKGFTKIRDTGSGGFDSTYSTVLYTLLVLVLVLCIWVYRIRVRAGLLLLRIQEHANVDSDSGGATPTGVVRPVSLP